MRNEEEWIKNIRKAKFSFRQPGGGSQYIRCTQVKMDKKVNILKSKIYPNIQQITGLHINSALKKNKKSIISATGQYRKYQNINFYYIYIHILFILDRFLALKNVSK